MIIGAALPAAVAAVAARSVEPEQDWLLQRTAAAAAAAAAAAVGCSAAGEAGDVRSALIGALAAAVHERSRAGHAQNHRTARAPTYLAAGSVLVPDHRSAARRTVDRQVQHVAVKPRRDRARVVTATFGRRGPGQDAGG